tara:strand:+ start:170 stop:1579 length:1410 start_codon:yes stop_codon:yes gene_type:complete
MVPLVEIPELVRHYAPYFEGVFSEQALEQFKRYISGLLVSENKTVDGINRLFVYDVRHQSSLNRLLTDSRFSVAQLHGARLKMLWSLPGTSLKPQGVLSVDDTLLTHYGQQFENIAKLFDHSTGAYVWAHNLVNLHYSDDVTDYPIDFQLWEPAEVDALEAGLKAAGIRLRDSKYDLKKTDPKKWRTYLLGVWQRRQQQPEVQQIYQSKLLMAQDLLRRFFAQHPACRLPVTFDNWYTQPAFCTFLDQTLGVAFVGTLKGDDERVVDKGTQRLDAFDAHLQERHYQSVGENKKPLFKPITIHYKGEEETYYSYCKTHRIKNFGRLRLVINHQEKDLSDTPTVFISNRTKWQAEGITRIRRHRWPVEVYHEEGKADGLDQYQVRSFEAIGKHIAFVSVTYSLLRVAQHDSALLRKLRRNVHTTLEESAGACRRNTQAQALWALACCIQTALAQGQTLKDVMQPILATVAR